MHNGRRIADKLKAAFKPLLLGGPDKSEPDRTDLAAVIGLYGLHVWTSASSHHNFSTSTFNTKWSEIKRLDAGLGSALNGIFDELSVHSVEALKYRPDYRTYTDSSLAQAMLVVDRLDIGKREANDFEIRDDVIYELLAQDSRNKLIIKQPLTTPLFLNELVAQLLFEPSDGQGVEVYDPACGSGGSLITLHRRLISESYKAHEIRVSGQDVDARAIFIAAWNLLLNGIDNFRLEVGDALNEPIFVDGRWPEQFDLVLTQPPVHVTSDEDLTSKDPFQRFRLGNVLGSRADYAFVQHMLASLRPSGRAAIMLPVTALSRSGFEEEVRAGLIHTDVVEASVSFQGGIPLAKNTPAAILLFDKNKPAAKRERIFFSDEEIKGSRSVANPPQPDPDIIVPIAERVHKWNEVEQTSRIVGLEALRAHRYKLAPQVYVSKGRIRAVDVEALEAEIELAEDEMLHARREFKRTMRTLPPKIPFRNKKQSEK